MLRNGIKGVALAGVIALALVACSPGGGSGGGGDTIKVGTSLPLTGEFSQLGGAAEQGYRVWEAMVNESGGLLGRDVKVIVKDDATNQDTVVADYNALISQDKVDLLLGTFSSSLNLPASAVAEKNKMLYVEPAGGAPDLFNRGFKYLFFSQQATAAKAGLGFANYIAGLPASERPKTAAYPSLDDPFASATLGGIQSVLEAAGIKTVYQETYAIDAKNFDSIVTAMKAKQPDIVVHGAGFEDGVGLVRAMLKADLKPTWLYQTTAPSLGQQYADAVGAENTEGIAFSISHAIQAKTPGNEEFVAKYREMYKGDPPEDAADAFAAAEVLQAAVEAVGGLDDQLALADWLRNNKVDTILGTLAWAEDGSPTGESLTGQWQDGAVEFVLPTANATKPIVKGWSPGK
jgi:branched-chain amino acid transport system substrate-binding protein